MLDLRRLRLLRELHRRGTVGAVAGALSYSPSTVSQQLAVLEREAGVRLLEPAGRRVRLTDAALVLVEHADALLGGVERAEADLAAAAGAVVGRVGIASFQTGSLQLAIPAMTAVRATHPALRTELVEMEPEPALEALRSRALDLVIADEYAGLPRPRLAGIARRDLLREPVLLVLPEGHRLAASGDPVALADLAGEPWVAAQPGGGQEVYVRHVCAAHGGFEPDVRHRADDGHVILGLVGGGHGVSLLPQLSRPGSVPGVAARPVSGAELRRTVFAAVREDAERRPALRAVLDALAAVATASATLQPSPDLVGRSRAPVGPVP
jgi:DNA-binding transcriptional LysR family regulator